MTNHVTAVEFCAIRRAMRSATPMPRLPLLLALALPCAASFVFACGGREPSAPSPLPPPTTAGLPVASATPPAASSPALQGPDASSLDRSVSPCDDFYQFACGGWLKATPVPGDESMWARSFSVIHQDNQKALRAILERDAAGDTRGDAYGRQLGDFWTSCMDEQAIEKKGATALSPEMKRIDALGAPQSLVKEVAHLHAIGIDAAFSVDAEVDEKDATRMILGIGQGGLGLPERDYYFRDDAHTKIIRDAYVKHIAATLVLLGEKQAQADGDAKAIMKLETDLAAASMTNTDLRDPQKIYHKLDLAGIKKLAPDVSWDGYLAEIGFPSITAINVGQPDFVKKFDAMTKSVPMSTWRAYLRWHLAGSMSPYLSQAFVDEWFRFHQVMTGAKEIKPRWKRCVRAVDQRMGEALAQPFVKEYLGEDGKRSVEGIVAGIETSMKDDIDSLSWMDDETRHRAKEKLAKVLNKIGYPAKWRSYDGLTVDKDSLFANVTAANAFEMKWQLGRIGKPVDKDEWEMTPPTVNAYYDPSKNEMMFPAGILQPPFYSKLQTRAVNLGAIGTVIGHELTHGFDDQGRQFDGDGNLRQWWTAPINAEFDKRASCVEKQADDYAAGDMHIKGKLTLGENIADLGGLKLAYAAFERAQSTGDATPTVDGLTPEQQFFVGFGQSWCTALRPEYLRLLLSVDPHSPAKFRVDGPLSNMRQFASAFQCKAGSPMVRSDEKRCVVW